MKRMCTDNHRGWFLALAAAIFLALGPALAPVLSASPRNNLIEICTAFGAVKMAVAGKFAPDAPEHEDSGASGHCLFCHLRQLAMLPPQPAVLPVPSGFALFVPGPVAAARLPSVPPLPYNPRAPPAFS